MLIKQATRDNLRLSIQIQIKYQLMQKNISIKALSGKKHFCTKDNVIKLSRILIRQKREKSFDFLIPYYLSGSSESILSLFPFLI